MKLLLSTLDQNLKKIISLQRSKIKIYFSLVAQLCLTLCDPIDYRMPDSPVLHYLPEFAQIHVHWVGEITNFVNNINSVYKLYKHTKSGKTEQNLRSVYKLIFCIPSCRDVEQLKVVEKLLPVRHYVWIIQLNSVNCLKIQG